MKRRNARRASRICLSLLAVVMLMATLCPASQADTDGTEPQITQQPDQLVLQLGTRWAGVEFELRTDAGVFPAPIVVDENGVLTMDLGGSTTYTLSCINSTVPIPDPAQDASPAPQQAAEDGQATVSDPLQQTDSSGRIPIGTLIIFLLGLACAAGGLIALYMSKRRRQPVYEEWDEEDEEDEDY